MQSLREILRQADARHRGVGHFNVSDLATLRAIVAAAQAVSEESGATTADTKIPVLIGVSEGEREFIGLKQIAAVVRAIRKGYDYPIYLNADHTHSFEKAKEAAEAGFDEILFDGSALPMAENIKQTLEVVKMVRTINPEIVVEGEIGYLGSSSEIIAARPAASLVLSTPEEAVNFVKETGVDVLAPAVGNMHGLLKEMVSGMAKKRLDILRISELKKALYDAGVMYMTLHGGSATADEDFKAAIAAGMTILHVSSELRVAWRRGVEHGLAANADEIAPYKILTPAVQDIQAIVANRLQLFNGLA